MGNNPSSRNTSATTTPRGSSSRRLLQAIGVGTNLSNLVNSDYISHNESSPGSNSSASGTQSPSSPVKPVTPPPLEYVDGGQTNSFGKLYPGIPDYDMNAVKKFILEKRLAPFFSPLDEVSDEKPIENVLATDQENHTSVESVTISQFKPSCDDYDPLECPICFMQYPPYFNYTKCCDQPICTECFIQIKRPETTFEPASCPYCVTPNFCIIYQSKDILAKSNIIKSNIGPENSKEESSQIVNSEISIESKDTNIPSVVNINEIASITNESSFISASLNRRKFNHPILTSDDIRPDWKERKQKMEMNKILEQQRIALSAARRRQIEAFSQAEVANAALFAAHLYEGVTARGGGNLNEPMRISRHSGNRRSDDNQAQYVRAMRYLGADVEELMLLEAMRRSMQDANLNPQAPNPPSSSSTTEPQSTTVPSDSLSIQHPPDSAEPSS